MLKKMPPRKKRRTVTPTVGRLTSLDLQHIEYWISRNPLRLWRTERAVKMAVLCNLLGVSAGTVQNWEAGQGQPSPEHFRLLAGDAGGRKWADEWATWLADKPQLEKSA